MELQLIRGGTKNCTENLKQIAEETDTQRCTKFVVLVIIEQKWGHTLQKAEL